MKNHNHPHCGGSLWSKPCPFCQAELRESLSGIEQILKDPEIQKKLKKELESPQFKKQLEERLKPFQTPNHIPDILLDSQQF